MSDNSKIEWTDATWNPITGCSVVSPGCTNCYAMRLAGTRMRHHWSRRGLTDDSKAGPVWNGLVRLNEEWMKMPLTWKKPRRIFVCAHGDLFHENVPDDWIDRVFAVMAICERHTFQVLTKRAERMKKYMTSWPHGSARFHWVADQAKKIGDVPQGWVWDLQSRWPLRNVWMGVSAERQEEAVERLPLLLDTPSAVRFASLEPLLGPIDLSFVSRERERLMDAAVAAGATDWPGCGQAAYAAAHKLDWVIVGGESGPKARPMNPEWARILRDQCKVSGVSFFMKQMAKKAEIPGDLLVREWPR